MTASKKGEKLFRTKTSNSSGTKYQTQSEIPPVVKQSVKKITVVRTAIINATKFLCNFVCIRSVMG